MFFYVISLKNVLKSRKFLRFCSTWNFVRAFSFWAFAAQNVISPPKTASQKETRETVFRNKKANKISLSLPGMNVCFLLVKVCSCFRHSSHPPKNKKWATKAIKMHRNTRAKFVELDRLNRLAWKSYLFFFTFCRTEKRIHSPHRNFS